MTKTASARAHISELMGLDKARGTIELPFAPLRNNFSRLETIGDAQIGYRSGYYLMVCLSDIRD